MASIVKFIVSDLKNRYSSADALGRTQFFDTLDFNSHLNHSLIMLIMLIPVMRSLNIYFD
jgi:hypothetical protein